MGTGRLGKLGRGAEVSASFVGGIPREWKRIVGDRGELSEISSLFLLEEERKGMV